MGGLGWFGMMDVGGHWVGVDRGWMGGDLIMIGLVLLGEEWCGWGWKG